MLIRRGWFFSIFLCAAITAQRSKMSSARLELCQCQREKLANARYQTESRSSCSHDAAIWKRRPCYPKTPLILFVAV